MSTLSDLSGSTHESSTRSVVQRYQLALEAAGMGMVELDFQASQAFLDPAAQQQLRLTQASNFSLPDFYESIFEEDRDAVRVALQQTSSSKPSLSIAFRVRQQPLSWVKLTGKIHFDEAESPQVFIGIIQESTDELLQRKALEEKAALFDGISQDSAIGIWIADARPFTTYISNRWLEWTGKPYEEHLGIGWLNCVVEEDRDQAKEKFLEDFQNQRPHKSEFTIRHVDGQVRAIDCSGVPQYHPDGTFRGYLGTIIDITERVNAQRQLTLRQQEFNDLIRQAPFAIGLYRTEEIIIDIANDALLQMWSKDASIIGQSIHDALPELQGQPFESILKQVYQTGIAYETSEQRAELFDGPTLRPYWFQFTYKPLFNTEGEVWSILHMAVDITERVLSRNQMAEAEANLRLAIDTAELATWQYNPVTHKFYASERFMRWFGLQNPVVDLPTILDCIVEEDRIRIAHSLQEAIFSQTYDQECTIMDVQTGRERIIHAQARSLTNEAGETYLLMGAAQNITNQKMVKNELERLVRERTEALRLKNIELEQMNESLKQFAFIASHDLQEPLRKIHSFISLLYHSDVERLSVKGAGTLSKIHASASRMSSLINDLLTFSGLTIKDVPMAPVSLEDLMKDIVDDQEESMSSVKASVQVQSLPIVWGNASQLSQLFQNLLSNAIKFSKPDVVNHIRITSGKVSNEEVLALNGLNPQRSYSWIDVQDEGIGFESEYSDRIFQMFQRLHSKDQYRGTGIGLAICRKVAENHQGIITATGTPNVGTTFRIYLPTVPPPRTS